ncbi:MAG: hypothetical protein NTX50_15760 [Candidatus Sumerlaeota bacterium]|nr:hypothetical protein [Candidatus Sumerlaeota bacterium]
MPRRNVAAIILTAMIAPAPVMMALAMGMIALAPAPTAAADVKKLSVAFPWPSPTPHSSPTPTPHPSPTPTPHPSPTPAPLRTPTPTPLPLIQFYSADASGYENQSPIAIVARLSRPSAQVVTVNYEAAGGTGVNGVDYVLAPGVLTFEPGHTFRMIALEIINNPALQTYRAVEIALSSPVNAALGDRSRYQYGIFDGEGAPIAPSMDRIYDERAVAGAFYEGPLPLLPPGAQPTTFALVRAPVGMEIDERMGVVTWAIPTLAGSPHTVSLRASNAAGASEKSWQLAVAAEAETPFIVPISDASVSEGFSYTGPAPRLTEGTQPITWSLVEGPTSMTIDERTGIVFWPNATTFESPFTIIIRAENPAGEDNESWSLDVAAANKTIPPQIASIPDENIVQGRPYTGPTPILTTGTQPIFWSLIDGPHGMTIDARMGVVSWTSPSLEESPSAITIRAANGAGKSDETWILSIEETEGAPLIKQMPDEVIEDNMEYEPALPELEEGTDPITWSLVQGPKGMTIDSETGSVYWTTPTAANSPYAVVIKAENPLGSARIQWILTVIHYGSPLDAYNIVYRINGKIRGRLDEDYTASADDGIVITSPKATEKDTLSIQLNAANRKNPKPPMIRSISKADGAEGFARIWTQAPIMNLSAGDGPIRSLTAVNSYVNYLQAGVIGSVRMAARQRDPAHTTIVADGEPASPQARASISLSGVMLDSLEASSHNFTAINLATKAYRDSSGRAFITTSGIGGILRSRDNPEVDFYVLQMTSLKLRGASLDTDVIDGVFSSISGIGMTIKRGTEIVPLPANIHAGQFYSYLNAREKGSVSITANGGNIAINSLNAYGDVRTLSSKKKKLGGMIAGGEVRIGVTASGAGVSTQTFEGKNPVNINSIFASDLVQGVFYAGAEQPDYGTGETAPTYLGAVKSLKMDPKGALKADYKIHMKENAKYPVFSPPSLRDPKRIIIKP